MGWFDDVIGTITTGADTAFKGIANEAQHLAQTVETIREVKSVEEFGKVVEQQWQKQQQMVTGAVLTVVGGALTVTDTAAGAVDKGLANYLGVEPALQDGLGQLVQQAQLQAAELQHRLAVADQGIDKVTEFARLAILNAVKANVEESKKIAEQVDRLVPGDLGVVDVLRAVEVVQK